MKMESLSTIKYKIVLVPFPFDDLSRTKFRPAVCLTNAIGEYKQVILAFITSQFVEKPLKTDIFINSFTEQFSETGLKVPSTIRLHRLLTVTTAIIERELGILPVTIQIEVANKLKVLFELDSGTII